MFVSYRVCVIRVLLRVYSNVLYFDVHCIEFCTSIASAHLLFTILMEFSQIDIYSQIDYC